MKNEKKNTDHTYDTVSEAVQGLKKRGYSIDFALFAEEDCLVCQKTSVSLSPDEFRIDEVYRFEGDSDPGDEMIVFGISSDKHQAKGIVVNGFGMYADGSNSSLVKYLQSHL
ncbi:phosphoribosylpyrophosphate synthetase [Pontibacter mangrovi]|uniref:Phosphoribosylpyrophosphate synthetase n=1 Tax=Pontibacter mangrovi TaxID=2589816 RepID=A0A501W610_9BACT|nr:phosphoribosylpyrophosphate synthetase [Pontibacter mangrovi]TPE44065.1 phosphoribosylpyrophosphate synthetase [Pontibacter mangrovi]